MNNNLVEKYISLGFGLVKLSGKRPTEPAWPNHPITDPALLNGRDIGLHHGYSRTCVLDIDHIISKYALSLVNVDLDEMLAANPYQISGNPNNPPKPLFRVPSGVKLSGKQLRWPDPDGQTNENGKVKNVTIFELRGGPGCQDVLPPSNHPDTGKPYTWVNGPPKKLDDIPFVPESLVRLWLGWEDEYEPRLKAGCPWLEPEPEPKPKPNGKYNGPPNPDFDVTIVQTEFNNHYSPGDILERNGYIPKGKKWLCPSSSTGIPGVIRLRDDLKIMSFHGSDPLSDGRPHDAYDCYVILEHVGDKSAAWRAGKDDLGLKMNKSDVGHRAVNLAQANEEAREDVDIIVSAKADLSDYFEVTYIPVNDQALIIKARSHSWGGDKFKRLWAGDWTGYDSKSEAQMSLCRQLAYWTGRDIQRMDRLFRRSKFFKDPETRAEWVKPSNAAKETCGMITMTLACLSCNKVFSVSRKGDDQWTQI